MTYELILLVDDNATTIFYNVDVLEDIAPQAKISSFDDSEKFIEEYISNFNHTKNRILLLLDINMPNKNGYEVLETLEEELDNIDNLDVIMLTSSNLKADYEKATRFTNIIGYIEKPLTAEKFNQTINGIF